MGDLLLSWHLDLLRRNLGLVTNVLEEIETRFGAPVVSPALSADAVKVLLRRVSNARNLIVQSDYVGDTGKTDADDDPVNAIALLDLVTETLRELKRAPVSASNVLPTDLNLRHDLVDEAASLGRKVDNLMIEVGQSGSNGALWGRYHEVEINARMLYDEYVDLVRGVAVRQAHFDSDLCRVADAILKQTGSTFGWKSIAIPSRVAGCEMSPGALIRLRFPDWTVWTLPLAFQELGYVVVGRDDDLKEYLASCPEAERDAERLLLITALATKFVGPAYACSALLLRLDPGATGEKGEMAARQVGTIIETLEASSNPEIKHMATRLWQEWRRAAEQAHGITDKRPGISEKAKSTIGRVTRDLSFADDHWGFPVEDWASKLRQYAKKAVQDANKAMQDATEAMQESRDVALDPERLGIRNAVGMDWKDLLNAAWRCLVAPTEDSYDVVSSAEEVDCIARSVETLLTQWHVVGAAAGPPTRASTNRRGVNKS